MTRNYKQSKYDFLGRTVEKSLVTVFDIFIFLPCIVAHALVRSAGAVKMLVMFFNHSSQKPQRRYMMQLSFSACVSTRRLEDLLRAIETRTKLKKGTLFTLTLAPCNENATAKRAVRHGASVGAQTDANVNDSVNTLRATPALMETYSVLSIESVLGKRLIRNESTHFTPQLPFARNQHLRKHTRCFPNTKVMSICVHKVCSLTVSFSFK